MTSPFLRACTLASAIAIVPGLAPAQSGAIRGSIRDVGGEPVSGAQVLIPVLGLSALSTGNGTFVVRSVPTGTYGVRIYRLGFRPRDVPNVVVSRASETAISIVLEASTVQLNSVVVSASRRVEKITDAPATVTRLEAPQIENTVGNSFAPALKQVNGIELIQIGVTNIQLNARGFHTSFNNRLLMLEDGRIATMAESGLPVSTQTTIPKVDLAAVEMLVGPGSALYGPDASNGVLTLETKDPRQYQGWTIEATGGSRSFYDAQARVAKSMGRWAWKLAGETEGAADWTNAVFYPAVAAGGSPIAEKNTDFHTDVSRASGTLAWYPGDAGRLQLTAGISRLNGIGQTSVGRNQLVDYGYRDYQLQYTGSHWFAQAYMTNSLTNGTFALNAFSQNSVRFPALSTDSLKALSAFPADGRLQAAEVQNNFLVGALARTGVGAIDNAHVILGAQLRRDRVSSYQHWLSDRVTGNPIVNDQQGVYGQVESPLSNALRLVFSGRYDRPEKYDAQFSPKAAVLYSVTPDQTLRVTFNRAYKSPTVLQTDFWYPNFQPFVGVFGNSDGFDVKKSDGTVVNSIAPIKPETNTTLEIGYKAAVRDALFIDVAAYQSHFRDFHSPLTTIANPLSATTATSFPTTAYNRRTGAKITDASGGPQVALTYFNVGSADIRGLETGLRYYASERVSMWTNLSFIHVDTIRSNPTDPPEATAFNSASSRITAGLDLQHQSRTTGTILARYVNGYDFRSGVNYGRIPGFATVDLNANYQLRDIPVALTIAAQNIFGCVNGTSTAPAAGVSATTNTGLATYTASRKCGFGQSHAEMINMPQLGTTVFFGLRVNGKPSPGEGKR